MAKTDYQKHFKAYQKYNGKLPEYCATRRPKLNYIPTRSAFKRIKKRTASGPLKNQKGVKKTVQKTPQNGPLKKKKIYRKSLPKSPVPVKIPEPEIIRSLSFKHQSVLDAYLTGYVPEQAYMSVYKKCKLNNAKTYMARLLKRPEIKAYLDYQRSLARAQTQIDLQRLVGSHKEVAFYDLDQEVSSDLTGLDDHGSGELPEETKKYLRNTKVRYITVKNDDGSETLEQVIEYDIGLKYTQNEIQNARKELRSILIDQNHDVSAQSTHEEVREAWDMFIKKDINAMEFCYILEKLNCKIPEVIQKQAEAEIKSMQDEGMLIIRDAIPMMEDKNFSVDDQLKIVIERAAKEGNVSDMMSALKTLAAMKIIKTSFNFSIFSKFARMGFDGAEIDPDNTNLIEIEAQKWEE